MVQLDVGQRYVEADLCRNTKGFQRNKLPLKSGPTHCDIPCLQRGERGRLKRRRSARDLTGPKECFQLILLRTRRGGRKPASAERSFTFLQSQRRSSIFFSLFLFLPPRLTARTVDILRKEKRTNATAGPERRYTAGQQQLREGHSPHDREGNI